MTQSSVAIDTRDGGYVVTCEACGEISLTMDGDNVVSFRSTAEEIVSDHDCDQGKDSDVNEEMRAYAHNVIIDEIKHELETQRDMSDPNEEFEYNYWAARLDIEATLYDMITEATPEDYPNWDLDDLEIELSVALDTLFDDKWYELMPESN